MAPFEALYERKHLSSLYWSKIVEIKTLGPYIMIEIDENVRIARRHFGDRPRSTKELY